MKRTTTEVIVAIATIAALGGSGCRPAMDAREAGRRVLAQDLEIDHFYTYAPREVSEDAAVAALRAAGLTVAERRFEFPEGASGRYVHFENAYLEILFQDPDVLVSHPDARRRAAWQQSGTSPFGVAFHRRNYDIALPDVQMRSDTVKWFTNDRRLLAEELWVIGSESDSLAPLFFIVPQSMSVAEPVTNLTPEAEARRMRERTHALGRLRVEEIRLFLPPASRSAAAQIVSRVGGIRIEGGEAPLLEIILSSAAKAEGRDLRPLLPLKVTYRD